MRFVQSERSLPKGSQQVQPGTNTQKSCEQADFDSHNPLMRYVERWTDPRWAIACPCYGPQKTLLLANGNRFHVSRE
jgi:hypothetical protein